MSASDSLKASLGAVDWNKNAQDFLSDNELVEAVSEATLLIAQWSRQLESADRRNLALCFVRSMQTECQHISALIGLSLYKPAAASMRTLLESALYYTYFRSHPVELSTLVIGDNFFMDKRDVLEYYNKHIGNFNAKQKCFNLIERLNKWYKEISSLVHGQIPGVWITHSSLDQISHDVKTKRAAADKYTDVVKIVHHLFLCTLSTLWSHFSQDARRLFLVGIGKSKQTTLGISQV